MIERLPLAIGGLSSKVFAAVVTGTSGLLGMVTGAAMTSQMWLAAISGATATGLAAVLLVIPRVMEQRRKSRESSAKLQKELLEKMTDLHAREVDFYKAQIASERLISALQVKAKHKAVNEWGAIKTAYVILAAQLRANKIAPEIEITLKDYDDIVGDSDAEITQIAKTRVAETPAAYPLSGTN